MTIVVGSNSYLNIVDADTYWSNRNNSIWSAASLATKEKGLLEATQYLDGYYNFIGTLADHNQSLSWPRSGATVTNGNFKGRLFNNSEIPNQIKEACAELALLALANNIQPSLERGGLVKREKVDVLEIEYAEYAPAQKSYTFVTTILTGLTTGSNNQIKLGRS